MRFPRSPARPPRPPRTRSPRATPLRTGGAELSLTPHDLNLDFASEAERWMRMALREAELAAEEDEVPVGCVIVQEGRVIGRGHNRVESLQDPTAHAEILALTAGSATAGSWRLIGAHAYVTIEPCLMCVGALMLARVEAICFGPREPKFGACG